jgi:hypothetical protein
MARIPLSSKFVKISRKGAFCLHVYRTTRATRQEANAHVCSHVVVIGGCPVRHVTTLVGAYLIVESAVISNGVHC